MNSIRNLPRSEKLARVGLYDLEKILGKGNFATVRLGTHRLTGTRVAVKVVDKKDLDPDNLEKIGREIKILRKLSHENIIQLYQVMETEDFIHIVTEYASTGEVFDFLIENGKLSEPEAARKFSQMLKAINHCHRNKVVHRDLKAENLLLDHKGNIKLADFGFSNYFNPGDTLATWCGSPPYAAPELFEGKPYDGQKADIWSLGVILYILVSGSLPFDGQTLQELRSRIVSCQFRIPFYISQHCENLIKSVLVIEPGQRIGLELIARHPWFETMLDYSSRKSFIAEISSTFYNTTHFHPDEMLLAKVAALAGDGTSSTQVLASVTSNAGDNLSAMYRMLSSSRNDNHSINEVDNGGVNVSIKADDTVTEVFIEGEEPQQRKLNNSSFIPNGRRHTFGFPEPKFQLEAPPQSSIKYDNIFLKSNANQHPLLINQVSLGSPGLQIPSDFEMGRRASECGIHSKMTDNLLANQTQFKNAEYLGGVANQPPIQHNLHNQNTCPSLQSPRKRRTGLRTVTDNPPNIPPELVFEVENRISSQRSISPLPPLMFASSPLSPSSSSSLSPSPYSSPCKLNLRQRRSGLSVVTEGKQTCRRVSSLKEPYSTIPPSDRHSPTRRLSDATQPSMSDRSLSELRALQGEYQQETLAFDFNTSKISQQFLQLPSSPVTFDHFFYNSLQHDREETTCPPSPASEELMAEMYEEMYSTAKPKKHSRSFSFPTSPSFTATQVRERHSLTHHLQELSLHQQQGDSADLSSDLIRNKGSITQGVPSLSATTPCSTPTHTPLSTPKRQRRPSLTGQTSQMLYLGDYSCGDQNFGSSGHASQGQGDVCPVIRVTDDQGDRVGLHYVPGDRAGLHYGQGERVGLHYDQQDDSRELQKMDQ